MLAAGMLIGAVLASFLGSCSAGRAAQRVWLEYLATIPTLHSRRRVLAHFLRTFEGARRHGTQWRVTDAAGFVGRQIDGTYERVRERFDAESGEVVHTVEVKPKHCPAASAGGLAAHDKRSPRQLNRYRQHMRAGGIMASKQPPVNAPDAKRPRRADGTWAYAQHWLKLPPTPEMLARWRGRASLPRALPPDCGDSAPRDRRDDLGALAELVDGTLSGPRDFRERIYAA